MSDILASGAFGRDDGVKCHACGGATFLTYDDGYGLRSYECRNNTKAGCEEATNVQADVDDGSEEPPDPEYDPAWDDDIDPIEFNQPEDSILPD